MYVTSPVKRDATPITIQKPIGLPVNGTGTFIPQNDANKVGIAMMIVMEANSFITMFRLFEIMDANVVIVPETIFR